MGINEINTFIWMTKQATDVSWSICKRIQSQNKNIQGDGSVQKMKHLNEIIKPYGQIVLVNKQIKKKGVCNMECMRHVIYWTNGLKKLFIKNNYSLKTKHNKERYCKQRYLTSYNPIFDFTIILLNPYFMGKNIKAIDTTYILTVSKPYIIVKTFWKVLF